MTSRFPGLEPDVHTPSVPSTVLSLHERTTASGRANDPIPNGLCPSAQGCEARATLGKPRQWVSTPKGLWPVGRDSRRNPIGVVIPIYGEPRVARCSQPWALGRNPFGIQLKAHQKFGAAGRK